MLVPFVAAGRNQARLDEVANSCRAQGADCVAETAEHTPSSLERLFRGAKVVVNTSGPFSLLGRAVVEASLAAGCHYLDSNGEQDFMLDMRSKFDGKFDRAKLLLSPSTAFLWAPGTCAAELLLAEPGIDSVKLIYAPSPLQTVASLQSMMRTARRPVYRIVDRELVAADALKVRYVLVPGTSELRAALTAGGAETVFFLGDARVRNCESLFASDALAQTAGFTKLLNLLQQVFSRDRVDKWTDALVLKFMEDPPAETPESTRFVVTALGEGNQVRARILLFGAASYIVTGFLGAMASKRLLEGGTKKFGFASLARAFGPRLVLKDIEAVGTKLIVEQPTRGNAAPEPVLFEPRAARAAGASP